MAVLCRHVGECWSQPSMGLSLPQLHPMVQEISIKAAAPTTGGWVTGARPQFAAFPPAWLWDGSGSCCSSCVTAGNGCGGLSVSAVGSVKMQ